MSAGTATCKTPTGTLGFASTSPAAPPSNTPRGSGKRLGGRAEATMMMIAATGLEAVKKWR